MQSFIKFNCKSLYIRSFKSNVLSIDERAPSISRGQVYLQCKGIKALKEYHLFLKQQCVRILSMAGVSKVSKIFKRMLKSLTGSLTQSFEGRDMPFDMGTIYKENTTSKIITSNASK